MVNYYAIRATCRQARACNHNANSLECAVVHTRLLLRALHRVRLTGSRLAVGKDADVVAVAGGANQLQENALFFECFPYVCPEPVLVKSSFLYINGSKRPFFHLAGVLEDLVLCRIGSKHLRASQPADEQPEQQTNTKSETTSSGSHQSGHASACTHAAVKNKTVMDGWHTALHCTALHCTALHCTALHCTALHCTALHCTAHT
jgi:hypothetical protein